MKQELHLFIVWEHGRYRQLEILNDIQANFEVIRCYEVTWSQEFVANNFTRFYGTKLENNSYKEKEAGNGPFLLVVVLDKKPEYVMRETSRREEIVNAHMFDAKCRYREMTGGGFKVHATNSPEETNHDLTLLLGLNVQDFLLQNSTKWDGVIQPIQRDLEGAHGWNSIQQLFYVLSAATRNVVLRGLDIIRGNVGGDRDIDILTDNVDNLSYIINSQEHLHTRRPHIIVRINNVEYYLDIWSKYIFAYDALWCDDMLSTCVVKNGVCVLSLTHCFYSLLYHAYIQKPYVKDDYIPKLTKMANALGIEFVPNPKDAVILLDRFMAQNGYEYIRPIDTSVHYNLENIAFSKYANRYGGKCIRAFRGDANRQDGLNPEIWISKVFEKESSFIKAGTNWLINNEAKFLKQLESYSFSPKVLNMGVNGQETYMEIERVNGTDFQVFFANPFHQRKEYIREFIQNALFILQTLAKENIIHRDIKDDNFLVYLTNNSLRVNLIDYGWAIHKDEQNTCLCPSLLGANFGPKKGYNDFYNLGSVLIFWKRLPYIQRIIRVLRNTTYENIDISVAEVEQLLKYHFGIKDYLYLGRKILYQLYVQSKVYIPKFFRLVKRGPIAIVKRIMR